ncbi:MAG: hypothetical protein J5727_04110 [Kiritimatiellae bacterium]|nr:hypothetical protein [Kiritimatiellia bacterium]
MKTEKKLVTISRALKEKNRVAGRLAKARKLVDAENSKEKNVPRRVDVAAVRDEARALAERLVAIKSAIAVANAPIVGKIIELDEAKSAIVWLNELNVHEGVFDETINYGGRIVREYEAVIGKDAVLKQVEELQRRADDLQDELDEFNVSTKVEIEIDA